MPLLSPAAATPKQVPRPLASLPFEIRIKIYEAHLEDVYGEGYVIYNIDKDPLAPKCESDYGDRVDDYEVGDNPEWDVAYQDPTLDSLSGIGGWVSHEVLHYCIYPKCTFVLFNTWAPANEWNYGFDDNAKWMDRIAKNTRESPSREPTLLGEA